MQTRSVQRKAVSEEVVTRLRAMINDGGLQPGDRLPAERKLAEQFQASRASVREGIRILAESGLLESRQGAGTFVRERPEATLIGAVLSGKYSLEDVFAVRMMLEPEIAALAARNGTPEAKASLEALLATQEQATQASSAWGDFDLKFHHALAEASGNPVLLEMVSALHEGFARSREESVQFPLRQKASLAAHRSIVKAILQGCATEAESAMRRHLEDVKQIIFSRK